MVIQKHCLYVFSICTMAFTVIGCRGSAVPLKLSATDCEKRCYHEVQAHLNRGGMADAVDEQGNTALHKASWRGHLHVANVLIKNGAVTEPRNQLGRTPLHYAAMYGRLDIAKLLVSRGVEVNAKDSDGLTALNWARKFDRKETAEYLYRNGGVLEATVALQTE